VFGKFVITLIQSDLFYFHCV